MSIPRGCGCLGVTEQSPKNRQSKTTTGAEARVGMPQVVKTSSVKTSSFGNCMPGAFEVWPRLFWIVSRHHVRADLFQPVQDCDGGGVQYHGLPAGLRRDGEERRPRLRLWAGGCRSGATANQNHKCDFSVDVSCLSRIPHRPNGPGRATLYAVDSRSYPHSRLFRTDSVRGPNCPVPPWSRTVKEPRTPRLFHFSEWTCMSQKFNDRRARAAHSDRTRWPHGRNASKLVSRDRRHNSSQDVHHRAVNSLRR
jgi:hypothetical protein